ncbi:Bug family tripartite tricarboxylate transporter substrate binding protein [Piscinibacter koreensis]|uniref:Tripartite tricarboxylate transporter substrate binding protein n=1 Tax=Piscinibacter koreensis TaxID=2742824 RepID=A0A7Y6NP24_9BURK|nr:tripartite tricarboxylate transporter substrate binding protein [Schlegelella koreensis]NUZ06622.1 tripartite tricarboxylate transporter substrate binding protein [Schlegelella koreensis]
MRFTRRIAAMAFGAGVLLAASAHAQPQADSYPERAITVVVPWPAGGFTDRLGRLMAEKMQAILGKPVLVENRPGASAGIGSEQVMRAAPDGYTLLVTSTDGTVKLLQGKGTDPVTQFTQIAMLAAQPVTLSVGPKFKGSTLAQFVDEAKRAPGSIAYASNGEGGATHYGMEIFARQAGIQLSHIPYKGTAPALQDLVGGQVEATLVSLQGVGAMLQGGRARALAITAPQRVAAAPNIPTFAESGYPGFDLTLWYGMVGPKGMPEPIVRKLNQLLRSALAAPDVQQALRSAAAEPVTGSPEEMLQFVQNEAARWRTMIR